MERLVKNTEKEKIHRKLLRELRNYSYYIVNDKKKGFEAIFFDHRQAVNFANELSKVANMEVLKMEIR